MYYTTDITQRLTVFRGGFPRVVEVTPDTDQKTLKELFELGVPGIQLKEKEKETKKK
jgi:hypothetical protein